jgi:hypothetical protein
MNDRLLIAGFHGKHLQLQALGINLLASQGGQILEVMDPGGWRSANTFQALNNFSTACWAVKPQSSSG